MTGRLRLSTEAQQDILDAKSWYAEQEVYGLDLRLQAELDSILARIE